MTIETVAGAFHAGAAHLTLPTIKSFSIHSELRDAVRSEPCAIGIDEAGRGPVLGPMVYSICIVPVSKKEELKKLGVDDSKQLTEEQRNEHMRCMHANVDYIAWSVNVLTPQDISSAMLRRDKYNLNALSHDTAIAMIKWAVAEGVDVAEIFVDTVGPPDKYQSKLQAIFPRAKCVVAKKADSLYPVVSAASIAAKITRDEVLQRWLFKEQVELSGAFGSGYPGDPATKAWLKAAFHPLFGFPGLIRFSWSTCTKFLDDGGYACKWACERDLEGDEQQPTMTAFLSQEGNPQKRAKTEGPADTILARFKIKPVAF